MGACSCRDVTDGHIAPEISKTGRDTSNHEYRALNLKSVQAFAAHFKELVATACLENTTFDIIHAFKYSTVSLGRLEDFLCPFAFFPFGLRLNEALEVISEFAAELSDIFCLLFYGSRFCCKFDV